MFDLHSAFQQGVQGAAELLYCRISALTRRWSTRISGVGYDTADLGHDVFLTVSLAIRSGSVRHPGHLDDFIRSTVRHKAAVLVRRQMVIRRFRPVSTSQSARFADQLAETDLAHRVSALLDRLTPEEQTILRRFYLEGVCWKTIASDLHLTANQFRLRKCRALARLRILAGSLR